MYVRLRLLTARSAVQYQWRRNIMPVTVYVCMCFCLVNIYVVLRLRKEMEVDIFIKLLL